MSQAENSKPSPSSNSLGWYITHKVVLLIIIFAAFSYITTDKSGFLMTTVAIGLLSIASATVMAGKVIDLGLPINCAISFVIAKLVYGEFGDSTSGATILYTALAAGIIGSGLTGFFTGKIITRKYIPPYFGSFAIPCIILYLLYLLFSNGSQQIGQFLSMNNMYAISSNTLYILAGIIGVIALLFSMSKCGKGLKATGSSVDGAIEAGINTDLSIIKAYTISGLIAGVAGIILASTPQDSIAMLNFPVLSWLPLTILGAIIGGNKFSGGKFDVLGSFLGGVIAILISEVILKVTGSSIQATTVILLLILIIMMATDNKKK